MLCGWCWLRSVLCVRPTSSGEAGPTPGGIQGGPHPPGASRVGPTPGGIQGGPHPPGASRVGPTPGGIQGGPHHVYLCVQVCYQGDRVTNGARPVAGDADELWHVHCLGR